MVPNQNKKEKTEPNTGKHQTHNPNYSMPVGAPKALELRDIFGADKNEEYPAPRSNKKENGAQHTQTSNAQSKLFDASGCAEGARAS